MDVYITCVRYRQTDIEADRYTDRQTIRQTETERQRVYTPLTLIFDTTILPRR